jgi:predicted RNA-binding protein with EMAP domain
MMEPIQLLTPKEQELEDHQRLISAAMRVCDLMDKKAYGDIIDRAYELRSSLGDEDEWWQTYKEFMDALDNLHNTIYGTQEMQE